MYTEIKQVCIIYVNSVLYNNTVQGSRNILVKFFVIEI